MDWKEERLGVVRKRDESMQTPRFLLEQPNCWGCPLMRRVQRDKRKLEEGRELRVLLGHLMLRCLPKMQVELNEDTHLFPFFKISPELTYVANLLFFFFFFFFFSPKPPSP